MNRSYLKIFMAVLVILMGGGLIYLPYAQANEGTTPQLLAHWDFEEGSGSSTVSESVSGQNSTIVGATWSTDVAGAASGNYSLEFDGVNDYIDTVDLDINNDFTISAWVKPDNATNRAIISKHSSSGANWLIFGFYSGYHLNLRSSYYAEDSVLLTRWQHVVIVGEETASGTHLTMYRDGLKLWEYDATTMVDNFSGGKLWTIGQDWDSSTSRTDFFDGNIDDIRIYDGAMTTSEVADLSSGTVGSCTVPGEYSTIPQAIFAACNDIVVASGTYEVNTSVYRDVTIRGAGQANTILTVPTSGNRRHFANLDGVHLTLLDLTLQDGHSNTNDHGMSIYNNDGSHLTLNRVTMADNEATGTSSQGGAIYSDRTGVVEIIDSTISNNYARYGGGIYISGFGMLTVTNSTITNNDAAYGGAIYLDSWNGGCGGYAKTTIDGTTISDNTTTSQYTTGGGGIYGGGTICGRDAETESGQSSGQVNITNSQFLRNDADFGGAINVRFDIDLDNVGLYENTAHMGGAIFLRRNWDGSGTIDIANSELVGNQVTQSFTSSTLHGYGGAIYAEGGVVNIKDSAMSSNSARFGAHLFGAESRYYNGNISDYGGTFNIERSLFSRGSAEFNGGAIWNGYITNIESSTFSENNANNGSAIYANTVTSVEKVTVEWSTIVALDSSPVSPKLTTVDSGGIEIANSIISGNSSNCDSSGVLSNGNNISSDTTCAFTSPGDLVNTDPLLSGFQDNGGSTWSYLPLDQSPAIDHFECTNPPLDQREFDRNVGVTPLGRCDVGAIEVQESVLFNYASPWERYFNYVSETFYQPGYDFRTDDLTRPDAGELTTIDDLLDNYAEFSEGRLLYRYCADDHATITAGQACVGWGNGSGYGHDIPSLDQDPNGGGAVSVDVHNGLLTAIDGYQFLETGPTRNINVLYQGQMVSAPVQTLAISATVDALMEMAYIPHVYGNEFMVDALRYSFDVGANLGATTGADIIQAEIDELELGRQQFENIIGLLEWAQAEGLTDHLSSEQFETFAIASERQIEATIEIIRRERLLGNRSLSQLLGDIDTGYVSQYLQANLLAQAIQDANPNRSAAEAQAIFLENGGWQVMNNLESLQQLAEAIRAQTNAFGYDASYVPRKSLADLLDIMGETGSCNLLNGNVTDANGELKAFQLAECRAGTADRSFDTTASKLVDEIDDLQDDFNDEAFAICGHHPADGNEQACDGGEMAVNNNELESAQLAAGLAWQRAQNIIELIRIEEERAGTVINIQIGTAQAVSAIEHSIGMLEAYREVTTTSTETEVWAPGSDPNDPTSGAYWLDFGKDGLNCLLSGATGGALGDGCQGNNDNLFGAIGQLFGIESEPSAIETVETISDPNAYEIAGLRGARAIREAYGDAQITGANSNAEIQRLLVQQADLLIEYEIAVEELNRVITERDLLVQRYRRAYSAYLRYSDNTAQDFTNRPDFRIIRDQTAVNAELARDRAVQMTYLTVKALEYELLNEPVVSSGGTCNVPFAQGTSLFAALAVARTSADLQAIICEVETYTLPMSAQTPQQNFVEISIAEDVWGLTDDNLTELLPYSPDLSAGTTWPTDIDGCNQATIWGVLKLRYCMFQERLQSVILDNDDVEVLTGLTQPAGESLYFVFNTELESDVEGNLSDVWNIRIADDAMCGGNDCGVSVNIVTENSYSFNGGGIPIVLTHQGQASYRNPFQETASYNPGPTALVGQAIPAGWPSDSSVNASMTASVDGVGGGVKVTTLTNLSPATTDWRFRLNFAGAAASQLDRTQINDLVIRVDTVELTLNRVRIAEIEAEMETLSARGQAIPNKLQAELTYLQDQAAIYADRSADKAPTTTEDVTPPSILSKDAIGGTYNGNLVVTEPMPLGIFDMAVTITRTGSSLTGELCGECTPLFDSAEITGIFTNTGTMTDTFSLQSVPFTQVIDGVTVTRTIWMVGEVTRDGDVMEGTYREEIVGFGDEVMVTEGTYMAVRPMQFYPFPDNSVPAAVTLTNTHTSSPNSPVGLVTFAVALTLVTCALRRKRMW